MICPRCGRDTITMKSIKCSRCGQYVEVYKKILMTSNRLYNAGLEKARVRDLSGAVAELEKSLKFNKYNIQARNLLGLVYYEMGEIVMALTEWILSKNFKPNDNEAGYYIDKVQSDPAKLEMTNQNIKKYNDALHAAKHDSEDMAVIALKKIVNQNPNFIRAQLLLALLYIKSGERSPALKCLNAVRSIDINNTTAIRYFREIGVKASTPVSQREVTGNRKVFTGDANVEVKEIGSYHEEKPRAFPFINVMIGVIIGLLVGIVLIAPTINSNKSSGDSEEVTDYGEKLAAKESDITSLKYQNENLTAQVQKLEADLKEAKEDDTLSAADTYDAILKAYKKYTAGNIAEALAIVNELDISPVNSKIAEEIVNTIKSEDANVASGQIFEKGRTAYNAGKYDEAKEFLEEAVKLNPQNYDALYFLGRLFHKQGDKEKAVEYYKKVIEEAPDSSRAKESANRLKELGVSTE